MTSPNTLEDMTPEERQYAAFITEMTRQFLLDNPHLFYDSNTLADDLAVAAADAHDLRHPDSSLPQWIVDAAEDIVEAYRHDHQ